MTRRFSKISSSNHATLTSVLDGAIINKDVCLTDFEFAAFSNTLHSHHATTLNRYQLAMNFNGRIALRKFFR
jgi:propanediol dehydratase small subunit